MNEDADLAREEQAKKLDRIADEAVMLAEHARVAATHFRSGEVPRAGAHALALEGHLIAARRLLDEIAVAHAAKARAVI